MNDLRDRTVKPAITIVLWLAAFVLAGAAQPAIQVSASVSPSQATLADVLQYQVTVKGSVAAGQPVLPGLSSLGLQVSSVPSRSEQISIFNNVQEASVTYTWQIKPTREGTFDIPPARVPIGANQTVASNSVRVSITKIPVPPAPAALKSLAGETIYWATTGNKALDDQLRGKLFLRPVIDKTEAYVYEQITLSYELYQAQELGNLAYSIEDRPNPFPNFVVEILYQPRGGQLNFRTEVIDGVPFSVATIEKVALFAHTNGVTTIPLMKMIAQIPVRSQRRRPRSPFDDPFFDDFFDDAFGGRGVPAQLIARPFEVKILPLPTEGKPADFSGSVGEYQIADSFDRKDVEQYDLVALRVQISGKGEVGAISQPQIPKVRGLEGYSEKNSSQKSNAGDRVGGVKIFEYVVRPTESGDIQFPGFEYVTFNPRSKTYERLKAGPLALHVRPAAKTEKPVVQDFNPPPTASGPGQSPSPVETIGRDIEYIRTTGFLSHSLTAIPLYDDMRFLLLQLVPAALVGISYLARRRREKREGNVAWARRRAARSVATKRLRTAQRLLGGAEAARFFEELARALRQFVADQVNESATGLTADRIAHLLGNRAVAEAEVAEMLALLDLCEAARYAASRPGATEMRQAYERAADLIDRLARCLR